MPRCCHFIVPLNAILLRRFCAIRPLRLAAVRKGSRIPPCRSPMLCAHCPDGGRAVIACPGISATRHFQKPVRTQNRSYPKNKYVLLEMLAGRPPPGRREKGDSMRSLALLALMIVARLAAAFHVPSTHSTAGMARWQHVRRTPVALTFNKCVTCVIINIHVYHEYAIVPDETLFEGPHLPAIRSSLRPAFNAGVRSLVASRCAAKSLRHT